MLGNYILLNSPNIMCLENYWNNHSQMKVCHRNKMTIFVGKTILKHRMNTLFKELKLQPYLHPKRNQMTSIRKILTLINFELQYLIKSKNTQYQTLSTFICNLFNKFCTFIFDYDCLFWDPTEFRGGFKSHVLWLWANE